MDTPHLATFDEARKELEKYWPSKQTKHLHTLDHVVEFMDFLGNPQDKIQTIHVAGTSGKTSTAYYAAALLHGAGLKVGLAVSPHVDEVNERVQVNMVPLNERTFCDNLGRFLELVEESGIQLSYFEVLYTFAFWYFVQARVDYVVVEVGVGGLLDSTNIISRQDKLCVITDVGLDHLSILGGTLSQIAEHKAGIIQLHNTVFTYHQDPVVLAAIHKTAKQKQADLHLLDDSAAQESPAHLPLFQRRNFALARAAATWALERDFSKKLSASAVKLAAHTYIPARMEAFTVGDKTVIVDVAHNGQKLAALGQSLYERYPTEPKAVLTGLVASRDYRIEAAAQELAGMGAHLIITSFSGPVDGPHHSVEPEELAKACREHGARSVEVVSEPKAAYHALMARPEKVVVVTGSFYLLNHIRPLVK